MGPLHLLTLLPPATIPILIFATIMWLVGRLRGRTLAIILALDAALWGSAWRIGVGIEAARASVGL